MASETTADKLAKALRLDLTSRRYYGEALDPSQVYEGQGTKAPRGHREIRVRHVNRSPVPSKTGKLRRHRLELSIHSTNADAPEEDKLSREVRRIADAIVDVYNGSSGGLARLIALNVPDVTFERVEASRVPLTMGGSEHWRTIPVKLDIDLWEKE